MDFLKQTLGVDEEAGAYEDNKKKFVMTSYKQPMWIVCRNKPQLIQVVCTAISGTKCGYFWTPSLAEMRTLAINLASCAGMKNVGNVSVNNMDRIESRAFHSADEANNSVIQAASQFNCLEFASPGTTPEAGISLYQYDRTQGPACAIACPAGTAWRNYFVKMADGRHGQTVDNQINTLSNVEQVLAKYLPDCPWEVQNGYIESTSDKLSRLNALISSFTPDQLNELKDALKVGVQWKTDVWMPNEHHHSVTQVYCSAISIAYSSVPSSLWAPIAQLVLDASYELTMWTAVWNNAQLLLNGETTLAKLMPCFLTKVGGGVFGNDAKWIRSAIEKGAQSIKDAGFPLDVRITHFGRVEEDYIDTTNPV